MSDFNEDDLDIGMDTASIPKVSNVLPKGKQRFMIEKIKRKLNKDETITTMEITLVAVGGESDRRKMWARHPIATSRRDDGMQKALEIGLGRIRELAEACGVSGSNLTGCIGKEVIGDVSVTPEKNGYPESNDIRKYERAESQVAAPAKPKGAAFLGRKKTEAAPADPETGTSGVLDESDLPF